GCGIGARPAFMGQPRSLSAAYAATAGAGPAAVRAWLGRALCGRHACGRH
ncbi:hypothetical protein JND44_14955, partial [Listeria monocytogenes]|nr:hypothetical protein [Listeria monocytogenes]